MKRKNKLLAIIFGTALAGAVFAQAADPNGVIVTVTNNNKTHVFVGLRYQSSQGTVNCLAQEYKLYPATAVTIKFSDVVAACQGATQFILRAAGTTHLLYHSDTITKIPAACTIESSGLTIAVECPK